MAPNFDLLVIGYNGREVEVLKLIQSAEREVRLLTVVDRSSREADRVQRSRSRAVQDRWECSPVWRRPSAAPGLISHAAAADADGITVTELWQEEEDWRNFSESSVEPNLPPDVPASEVPISRGCLANGSRR